MSSTQFHGKDTNVQTGGLESHRWLDRHKRSIMKPWRKKTVTADMGKYFHRQSFLYHSNNNPNAQIHLCVPKIQTEILRLQVQVKEKLFTEFSLSQALCNRDTFHFYLRQVWRGSCVSLCVRVHVSICPQLIFHTTGPISFTFFCAHLAQGPLVIAMIHNFRQTYFIDCSVDSTA